MNAGKNLVHGVVLTGWAVLGVLFSLKCLFAPAGVVAGMLTAGTYWLWFGGLAGVTSWLVGKFKSPVAALVTHGLLVAVLLGLPQEMPFSMLRLGLDLIRFG